VSLRSVNRTTRKTPLFHDAERGVPVETHTYINLNTRGHADMHDITLEVENIAINSAIRNGIVSIFTPSATSAITTIEYESGALEDLHQALDEIAPPMREYQHNLRWGDGNGHSHLRAALLGPSLCIPLIEKKLLLGTWQQVLFIDFDVRPRQRKVSVQIVGEGD
jgi:secondary thiamine-phosphate synthase enzyme